MISDDDLEATAGELLLYLESSGLSDARDLVRRLVAACRAAGLGRAKSIAAKALEHPTPAPETVEAGIAWARATVDRALSDALDG